MFNLKKAITEWRRQMLAEGIRSPVPLDELENHLRDDVERQMELGLNAEQAFETAVQRIGHSAALHQEFGKIAGPAPRLRRKFVRGFCGIFAGFCFIVAVPLVLVLSSCASGNFARHKQFLEEAGNYLAQLKKSGHLPGIAKDDSLTYQIHSSEADWNLFGYFNKQNNLYPLRFIADVSKKDDTSNLPRFQYMLVKTDENSGWRLQAARMFDEKNQEIDLTIPRLWAVGFFQDGQSIVTTSAEGAPAYMTHNGELIFWSAATGKKTRTVEDEWGIRSLACAPNGKFIVIGNSIGQTKLVNPITGKIMATLPSHSGLVNSVAVSMDSQLIASGSFDGSIIVCDASGVERAKLAFPAGKVNNVAFSPDSHALVATSRTGKAYLFDLSQNGKPCVMDALPLAMGEDADVDVLAFEPDGRKFVTGCQTSLKVWDASTCQLVRELNGCTSSVTGAAFSPDGGTLAITDSDGKLSLWNVETGERLKTVPAHGGPIFGVAFAPDGRRLATVGVEDYSLKIWDAQTLVLIASNTR